MWHYGQGGTEPTLDEVIQEPVIRLMMERDNVTEEALLRIIAIARRHLGGNPPSSARIPGSFARFSPLLGQALVNRTPIALRRRRVRHAHRRRE
jgi:hypothetical protein